MKNARNRDRLGILSMSNANLSGVKGGVSAALPRRQPERNVAMTLSVLRVSALALSAAALVLASPLPGANAATVARHYQHAAHSRVAHSRVAQSHVAHSR